MPSQAERESFRQRLLAWAKQGNLRDFPWRNTDSPYRVFVAEILLGATLATKVEPIYREFLARYPDLQHLAEADEDALTDLLEPLGLHNRRAAAFLKIAQQLAGEEIPEDEEALIELPYVGRYAANATLCFAFGQHRPIVDANVTRVYNRAFGTDLGQESEQAWTFAAEMLPEDDVRTYNLALLDFGAAICVSPTPRCGDCFYSAECLYYAELADCQQ